MEQANYIPSESNLAMRRWFQDARFGLFIHWGVYTVLGTPEWTMESYKMSVEEYEKLPPQFNPTEYDPAEWVALAKRAGMKYITITSRHHDGFALWDSKVSDYNIVKRTPYGRDVLRMLAEECRKQGIKLFFYYSHLDWHHPEYYPLGLTGHASGRAPGGDFNKYVDYMKGQLAELLGEEYGAAGIWFDGWWDQQVKKLPHLNRPDADPKETQIDWRLRETFDLIHELRPEALIGNNHHVGVFPGEDFQMFEKDLPGQDFAGGNEDAVIGELPLEMCETINDYWGYNKDDQNFKSAKDLIRLLVRAAGFDANLLLNIGPMGSGKIQPEFVERLEQIGAWMEKNGESIYGTRGGPLEPQPWGVTTRKGGTVFVHVLEDEKAGEGADGGRKIELALGEGVKVQSARLMHGGEVKFEQSGQGTKAVILHLPEGALDLVDTIVVLETEEISD